MSNKQQDEIEDWKCYHEIGHGIIAHIFDGYLYNFEKVTFNIKSKKLHADDEGYTIAMPVVNYEQVILANLFSASLIDGLYLLSGIAGASFFGSSNAALANELSFSNFKSILNYNGSKGDFDIILRANRPYGRMLYTIQGLTEDESDVIHFKLFQILKKLFIKEEIAIGIPALFLKLKKNKELLPSDFQRGFDAAFADTVKQEMFYRLTEERF